MAIRIAAVVESVKGAGRSRPSRLGPYSRAGAIAGLDGRSCAYRYYKKCRDDFLSYVGGEPTAIQRELVEQAAWMKVRIGMLNKRLAEDSGARLVPADSDLAYINVLGRLLMYLDFTRGHGDHSGDLAAAEARIAVYESMHGAPDEHHAAQGR
jgi:hypothetical protein